MKSVKFYIVFHCNLAFSSIEENQIKEVIQRCYYPLLDVIEKSETKVGIELSGYTLEKIFEYAPDWIPNFKKLIYKGLVEFIGSGYQQIIGPLVPYRVNFKNHELGLDAYQNIVGIKPKIAFLNEQVFSRSMIDIYKNFYEAIFMEWNNAYFINSNIWDERYGFYPAFTKGNKEFLPLIWTNSILFQQFQRTVHNQNSIEDYLKTIKRFARKGYKCIPIYSSDLEVFNYRPGRFITEANIVDDEWEIIGKIFKSLKDFGKFLLPSEILGKFLQKNNILELTNASFPIIVKKQTKYALSRWSVCGRGSSLLNTLCYNLYSKIKKTNKKTLWKELVTYWGSDFRTHVTQKKWEKALTYLKAYQTFDKDCNIIEKSLFKYNYDKKITLNIGKYVFTFLPHKGLVLESVLKNGKRLAFGTVNHGELDYIAHGADYYTGTSTIESPEVGKLSNLDTAENIALFKLNQNTYVLRGDIKLGFLAIEKKEWIIDLKTNTLTLKITINLKQALRASIRLGTFTLLPVSKNRKFWFACKNGGNNYEKFLIDKKTTITHNLPVSVLQSSNGGIGVTDGVIKFGINQKVIAKLIIDQTYWAPLALLQNSLDSANFLTRAFFSVQELDDTLKPTLTTFRLKYTIAL